MLPDDFHHVRQRKSTRWPRHAHSQARGAPAAWNWPACPASGTSGAASSSAASSGAASTQRCGAQLVRKIVALRLDKECPCTCTCNHMRRALPSVEHFVFCHPDSSLLNTAVFCNHKYAYSTILAAACRARVWHARLVYAVSRHAVPRQSTREQGVEAHAGAAPCLYPPG